MSDAWKKHLDEALDAAYASAKPWAADVRDTIAKEREQSFKNNEDRWKEFHKEVIRSSDLSGQVARVCADWEGRSEVSIEDMHAGIAAANQVCKARAAAKHGGVGLFLYWCE